MDATRLPLAGPRRFQWNAGAWFGSSLGSSAWMLVVSCFLVVYGQARLASIPATGFAVVQIGSVLLWSRRHGIYPFSALMALLGLLAIATPAVWYAVQSNGSPSSLDAMNWPESRRMTALVFAIEPAGMIWFFALEKSSSIGGKKPRPDSDALT